MNREIPGTLDVKGREFLYVEALQGQGFSEIVDEAMAMSPGLPLPKTGGVIEEKARILLNNGNSLLAVSYKGDLAGWKTRLVSYCQAKGRKWGSVSGRKVILSDGTELQLAECEVIFDP